MSRSWEPNWKFVLLLPVILVNMYIIQYFYRFFNFIIFFVIFNFTVWLVLRSRLECSENVQIYSKVLEGESIILPFYWAFGIKLVFGFIYYYYFFCLLFNS